MLGRGITIAACLAVLFNVALASPTDTGALAKRDYNGEATYYYQNGNAGSCGHTNPNSAKIVALSDSFMDDKSKYCGKQVTITNTGGGGSSNKGKGKTVKATVADTCPGCDETHIDCSTGLFEELTGGSLAPGVIDIKWEFS